jgi:hypothetical protein
MRMVILFALSIIVCGCGERHRLEELAHGLEEAWQPAPREFKLEMHAEYDGERVLVQTVLKNVSGKAVQVDAATLPWVNSDFFSVTAVNADGKVVARTKDPTQFNVSRISPIPAPMVIQSGASIDGRPFDLDEVRITKLPDNKDLLILWSYRQLKDWASNDSYPLSGITLLKARQ